MSFLNFSPKYSYIEKQNLILILNYFKWKTQEWLKLNYKEHLLRKIAEISLKCRICGKNIPGPIFKEHSQLCFEKAKNNSESLKLRKNFNDFSNLFQDIKMFLLTNTKKELKILRNMKVKPPSGISRSDLKSITFLPLESMRNIDNGTEKNVIDEISNQIQKLAMSAQLPSNNSIKFDNNLINMSESIKLSNIMEESDTLFPTPSYIQKKNKMLDLSIKNHLTQNLRNIIKYDNNSTPSSDSNHSGRQSCPQIKIKDHFAPKKISEFGKRTSKEESPSSLIDKKIKSDKKYLKEKKTKQEKVLRKAVIYNNIIKEETKDSINEPFSQFDFIKNKKKLSSPPILTSGKEIKRALNHNDFPYLPNLSTSYSNFKDKAIEQLKLIEFNSDSLSVEKKSDNLSPLIISPEYGKINELEELNDYDTFQKRNINSSSSDSEDSMIFEEKPDLINNNQSSFLGNYKIDFIRNHTKTAFAANFQNKEDCFDVINRKSNNIKENYRLQKEKIKKHDQAIKICNFLQELFKYVSENDYSERLGTKISKLIDKYDDVLELVTDEIEKEKIIESRKNLINFKDFGEKILKISHDLCSLSNNLLKNHDLIKRERSIKRRKKTHETSDSVDYSTLKKSQKYNLKLNVTSFPNFMQSSTFSPPKDSKINIPALYRTQSSNINCDINLTPSKITTNFAKSHLEKFFDETKAKTEENILKKRKLEIRKIRFKPRKIRKLELGQFCPKKYYVKENNQIRNDKQERFKFLEEKMQFEKTLINSCDYETPKPLKSEYKIDITKKYRRHSIEVFSPSISPEHLKKKKNNWDRPSLSPKNLKNVENSNEILKSSELSDNSIKKKSESKLLLEMPIFTYHKEKEKEENNSISYQELEILKKIDKNITKSYVVDPEKIEHNVDISSNSDNYNDDLILNDCKEFYSDSDIIKIHPLYDLKQEQNFNEIGINDFEFINLIGKGAYGKVYLVKRKLTEDYYAMKIINTIDNMNKNKYMSLKTESKVFDMVTSDFLIKAIFKFRHDVFYCFVMEYMYGGDFNEILRDLQCLENRTAQFYIAELILAVEHLHNLGIIHRDLKPDNMLLDPKGHIKLTDFGLSEIALATLTKSKNTPNNIREEKFKNLISKLKIEEKSNIKKSLNFIIKKSSTFIENNYEESPKNNIKKSIRKLNKNMFRIIGTPDYIAPEIIQGKSCLNNPCIDWWSVGIILFEFLVGIPPFNDDSPEKIFDNIINLRIDWDSINIGLEDDQMNPEAKDLIVKLLNPDPEKRLGSNGVDEIKNHKFFAGIDWKNLIKSESSARIIPKLADYKQRKEDGIDKDCFVKKNNYTEKEENEFFIEEDDCCKVRFDLLYEENQKIFDNVNEENKKFFQEKIQNMI